MLDLHELDRERLAALVSEVIAEGSVEEQVALAEAMRDRQ